MFARPIQVDPSAARRKYVWNQRRLPELQETRDSSAYRSSIQFVEIFYNPRAGSRGVAAFFGLQAASEMFKMERSTAQSLQPLILYFLPRADKESPSTKPGNNLKGATDTLFHYGCSKVFLAEDHKLEPFTVLPYAKVIVELVRQHRPNGS